MDEIAGKTKQKLGHVTRNTRLEAEGTVQLLKGKIESAVGEIKDAVHDANVEARGRSGTQKKRYVKD